MRDALRVRWLGLTLLLVVALAACGAPASASGSPASSSQQHLSVPTYQLAHPGIAMKALLTGRLSGRADTQQARACFWIAASAGRTILLWPVGYVAETDPLRILNGSRKVVGTVGEHISWGGGAGDVSQAQGGLEACGQPAPTHVWIVAPTTGG